MNPFSTNSYLFYLIDEEFIAPEYVKLELEKYREDCIIKSNLSEHEFDMRKEEIEEYIEFFNLDVYEKELKKAILSLPDPKDSPYLALALSLNCPIWSNDPHFKEQSLVKVFTTRQLIHNLFGYRL